MPQNSQPRLMSATAALWLIAALALTPFLFHGDPEVPGHYESRSEAMIHWGEELASHE